MWGWKEFYKEFSNISILQLVFLKVFIMAILATMTLNTLKYIRKTLTLKILVWLYQRPFDCLNITYIITSITDSRFEDLDFLVLSKISGINNIEITIIFIDSIEKDIAFGKYFQIFLLDNLKDRGKKIISSFSSTLKTITKTNWLEDFLNGDIRIIICIDVIEMKVDI